jgi:hypothetical protein
LQPAPQAQQSFTGFTGPTASFALAGGRYQLDYTAVGTGNLYFEAEFPGPTYGQTIPPYYTAIRVLNALLAANNVSITLASGGNYRLNNTGPAVASCTISGPL